MNRSKLIALALAKGYKGDIDLAKIKAFFAEQNIVPADSTGTPHNLETVWNKAEVVTDDDGKKAVTTDDDEDSETVTLSRKEVERLKGEDKARREKARGGGNPNAGMEIGATSRMSPTGVARAAAAKSYNRKAAEGRGATAFPDADMAESFGAWFRANHTKHGTHEDREIIGKANIGTTNTSGGALIPMDFQASLIDLKEVRGTARQLIPFMPMSRDRVTLPRRTGGLTVYAPGEAGSITESNPTVDNVTLTATKMATLTYVSTELMHDSAISVGEMVAREVAYAFADKEDEILFNGDGTSTYFGYQGIRHKILNLTATRANIAGLVVATGNLASEFTLADYQKVVARLPEYADKPGVTWCCSRTHYFETMQRLALAAGGATAAEISAGNVSGRHTFLSYPVRFVQVMPKVDTNDVVHALLGLYSEGVKAGEVTGSMEIATDASVGFASDVIAIRGLQRVGFAVHDVGNESGTATSRVPGPIVGLLSAAS